MATTIAHIFLAYFASADQLGRMITDGPGAHPTTFAERSIDAPQRYQEAAQRYAAACASCHGSSGEGGLSGVPLDRTTAADRQTVINAIRYGVGGMPASRGGMSDEQIIALADYVAGLR